VQRRGYLLLEVTIGGAMAAVVLFGMMEFVLSGRVQNITARRMVMASQIANEALEKARAFESLPPGPTAIPAGGGTYQRTVASASCSDSRGSVTLPCNEVTVRVDFDVVEGGVSRQRSVTMAARVYP
jgi:hypothetical protein